MKSMSATLIGDWVIIRFSKKSVAVEWASFTARGNAIRVASSL
jgi:hypothetical protein